MNLYRALQRVRNELNTNFELELLEEPNGKAYSVIFMPGVGHFEHAMRKILESGLDQFIFENHRNGAIVVGICLGMQLLFEESDESFSGDTVRGLGLLKGRVVKLSSKRLPHVGWNTVQFSSPQFEEMSGRYFYFVHSYRVVCEGRKIVGTCEYDGEIFPAVVMDERIVGVQFHPEKSHTNGRKFLRRLLECALYRP